MNTMQKQQGATLIIALVVLLVMTAVGIATMRSSNLQQLMASNNRQQLLARNAAEFALRDAERWLVANMRSTQDLSKFDGSDGLYAALPALSGSSAKPLDTAKDITLSENWKEIGVEVKGLSDDVKSQDPKYIIEYVGRGQTTGSATQINQLNAGIGNGNVSPYFFRITAIGWSRDQEIYSVLESIYRTGYGDGEFSY